MSAPSVGLLTLGLLALPVACKSGLTVRGDAGVGTDTRVGDALPDQAPVDRAPELPGRDAGMPDLPVQELGSPDLATTVPTGFRFVNHTNQTAYVRGDVPVGCRRRTASGWQDCSFAPINCFATCSDTDRPQSCCMLCGQLAPSLYTIPAGGSLTIPWGGTIFITATAQCTSCQCQWELSAGHADFEASATVYVQYACDGMSCEMRPDGVIGLGVPQGEGTRFTVPFSVPSAMPEILIDIADLPGTDAGAAPDAIADVARADDASPFDNVPGHTFQIATSTAFPDASANGKSCAPSGGTELYSVAFAPDGKSVIIAPSILSQSMVSTGTLEEQSGSALLYSIDNTFGGGQLVVRPDGAGGLLAEIAIFGSGVPVVWCLQAPMTPAPEVMTNAG